MLPTSPAYVMLASCYVYLTLGFVTSEVRGFTQCGQVLARLQVCGFIQYRQVLVRLQVRGFTQYGQVLARLQVRGFIQYDQVLARLQVRGFIQCGQVLARLQVRGFIQCGQVLLRLTSLLFSADDEEEEEDLEEKHKEILQDTFKMFCEKKSREVSQQDTKATPLPSVSSYQAIHKQLGGATPI